jgi:ketol-acid reductoisomerase
MPEELISEQVAQFGRENEEVLKALYDSLMKEELEEDITYKEFVFEVYCEVP